MASNIGDLFRAALDATDGDDWASQVTRMSLLASADQDDELAGIALVGIALVWQGERSRRIGRKKAARLMLAERRAAKRYRRTHGLLAPHDALRAMLAERRAGRA